MNYKVTIMEQGHAFSGFVGLLDLEDIKLLLQRPNEEVLELIREGRLYYREELDDEENVILEIKPSYNFSKEFTESDANKDDSEDHENLIYRLNNAISSGPSKIVLNRNIGKEFDDTLKDLKKDKRIIL